MSSRNGTNGLPEHTGPARLGRATKHLVRRREPRDIAIIDHIDLDRVAAEELIQSGVRIVVNGPLGGIPGLRKRPVLAEKTFQGPAALWVLRRDKMVGNPGDIGITFFIGNGGNLTSGMDEAAQDGGAFNDAPVVFDVATGRDLVDQRGDIAGSADFLQFVLLC